MLYCFENLIGLYATDTPTSGRYMHTLPGITMRNISAGAEEKSTKTLYQDLLEESANMIEQEFRSAIYPHMKHTSLVENDTVGRYKEGAVAAGTKYKGIRVRIDRQPYLALHLHSFSLKLDAAVTTNVYLYDLMTGTTLDTFEIITVADTITRKVVNKTYRTNGQDMRLALMYDSSVGGTYQTLLSQGGCVGCGTIYDYSNKYSRFTGVEIGSGAAKVDSGITATGTTGGMTLDYSLECDVRPVLCNMATLMAEPLRYKLAEMIFTQLQVPSNRINSLVTVQKEEVDYFRQYYEGKYREEMNRILHNLRPPNNDCFYCYQTVSKKVSIP